MPPESPHAYRRYMWENLFTHVNVRPEHVHIPDGGVRREDLAEQCAAYERAIAEAGGIDLQLLGVGKSGHRGFNQPRASQDSRTRPGVLDTRTRQRAAADVVCAGHATRRGRSTASCSTGCATRFGAVASCHPANRCSSSPPTPTTTSFPWAACCASCGRTRTPSWWRT